VPLPADQTIPQVSNQFFIVPLAYAEEIHDIEVEIVQDFHIGGYLMEKHLRSPRKRLDIRQMVGQKADDFGCEAVLAADVGNRADHRSDQK
jgi:hypothetical protein